MITRIAGSFAESCHRASAQASPQARTAMSSRTCSLVKVRFCLRGRPLGLPLQALRELSVESREHMWVPADSVQLWQDRLTQSCRDLRSRLTRGHRPNRRTPAVFVEVKLLPAARPRANLGSPQMSSNSKSSCPHKGAVFLRFKRQIGQPLLPARVTDRSQNGARPLSRPGP